MCMQMIPYILQDVKWRFKTKTAGVHNNTRFTLDVQDRNEIRYDF